VRGLEDAHELSGGIRKRAFFARFVVLDPRSCSSTSPTLGLDPVRTPLLCERIKEILPRTAAARLITRIMSARRVAAHISVLWRGWIWSRGRPKNLSALENPVLSGSSSPAILRAALEGVSLAALNRRPRLPSSFLCVRSTPRSLVPAR